MGRGIMESKFKSDKRGEEALASFLDTYLYSRMVEDKIILDFKRTEDKQTQLSGVDLILTTGTRDVKVDEKSTLQYINKDIPTFAMEIYYRGNTGWFLKDGLQTDAYLLVWPRAATTDLGAIAAEDFTLCDCMLIYKQVLRKYVNKFLSDEELLSAARALDRGEPDWKPGYKDRCYVPSNPELYLTISGQLYERPVNLVIKKSILKQLCRFEVLVEKDRIRFLENQ